MLIFFFQFRCGADTKQVDPKVVLSLRKNGYNVEVMSTEHAISTYNYLCAEGRLVAAALIPPERFEREESEEDAFESAALASGPSGNTFEAVDKDFWKPYNKD